MQTAMRRAARALHVRSAVPFALYLSALPLYTLSRVFELGQPLNLMTFIIPVALAAVSTAHMLDTRGARRGGLMLAAALLITFGAEALGSSTGLLFGRYHYTDTLGLRLFGLVPWLIPVAWLAMLYPAWETVGWLLRTSPRGNRYPALRVALAALALAAWDLSLDPRMVADGHWVWLDGGPYFGIPLSNFAGWVITGMAVFAAWSLIERRRRPALRTTPLSATPLSATPLSATPLSATPLCGREGSAFDLRLVPVWVYIVVWLSESVANVLFWSGPAVGLIVFVAMGAFGAPAALGIARWSGVVWPRRAAMAPLKDQ